MRVIVCLLKEDAEYISAVSGEVMNHLLGLYNIVINEFKDPRFEGSRGCWTHIVTKDQATALMMGRFLRSSGVELVLSPNDQYDWPDKKTVILSTPRRASEIASLFRAKIGEVTIYNGPDRTIPKA